MKLKNYTSQSPVFTSIARIEKRLVEIGAKNINKEYNSGSLVGIKFLIDVNHQTVAFNLPVKSKAVFDVMWSEISRPHKGTKEKIIEQAERTAWKIIADWVDIQCSMIYLEQAEILQIFLPYAMITPDKTVYQAIQENGLKALTA